MTRLAALLALVIALAVAGPGRAQETAQAPDYAAFQQTASEAERILSNPTIDTVALDAIRAELAIWRNRLLAAETANASTIQRLQGQIDALGPAPASDSGTSEPAEIAERRAALLRQLAEAQVPRVNALEGYNRAVSLIGEIDALMRARQNEALLERWPSPLLPSSWQSLGEASVAVLATIREEVGGQISDPTWRATFRDRALPVAIMLFLGGALVLNGRRWIDGLSGLAQRRKARDLLVFFLSLGQIFLPVVGAALVLGAVAVTGVVGEKLSHLLGAAISLLVMIVAATWLGGRLFPPEGGHAPALDLGAEDRAQARRVTLGIGVVLGVGALLRTMAEFEEVGQGARSVLLLPYFLGLAWYFHGLARLLRAVQVTTPEDEGRRFVARLIAPTAMALELIALGGPIMALAGFTNAADGLMRPAALTLGLVGLFMALQVPNRDLYALVTRKPVEEAGKALVPVLVNFGLAVLAVPVLALIWGMRPTELKEIYSRFMEGFSLGGARITPGDFLAVILVFALALLVTRVVQGALKSTVLPRTKMDVGAQNAIASGLGYLGIAIAALLAINAGGIDLTALAFVISALSIGIGFGLRNVIENFVAGIILLIERPISEGDWIEVGGNMGIVKSISVRSTVIETFDKQQLIVPNGDFITGTVTNWTRGSHVGRAVVNVGVAYGTDTRRVQEILLEIVRENPMVMRYPEPGVDFMGFGADSLDFRVRGILYDVSKLIAVKTEIHHRIVERFAEEGIEIPFAQRDIWLRNPEVLRQQAAEPQVAAESAPVTPDTPPKGGEAV